mmetsp:Transcript_28877/g.84659  ORF Transcript_28877/g.84659 Transcript_28877/m.84659 type:complete len:138 (-) Transcript_28877:232-645(-)
MTQVNGWNNHAAFCCEWKDTDLNELEESIYLDSLSEEERSRFVAASDQQATSELEAMIREQELNELRALHLASSGFTSPRTTQRTWGIDEPLERQKYLPSARRAADGPRTPSSSSRFTEAISAPALESKRASRESPL